MMLLKTFLALALVAITVTLHAAGLGTLLQAVRRRRNGVPTQFWAITRLLFLTTSSLIVLHLVEISVWGWFFMEWKCLPDAESAFYFSGVTYTTLGYGDVVLHEDWRLFGPVEALTGILMCGLSTSYFFALVSRIHRARQSNHTEGLSAPLS